MYKRQTKYLGAEFNSSSHVAFNIAINGCLSSSDFQLFVDVSRGGHHHSSLFEWDQVYLFAVIDSGGTVTGSEVDTNADSR